MDITSKTWINNHGHKKHLCKVCGKSYERKDGYGKNRKRFCSITCSSNLISIRKCKTACLPENMILIDVMFKNQTIHTKRVCKLCRKGNFVKKRDVNPTLFKERPDLNNSQMHEIKLIQNKLSLKYGDSFYTTFQWLKLRYETLSKHGATCMLCGSIEKPMHVDHIKPRSKFKELELDPNNLQVLCKDCNLGKSDSY